MTDNNTIFDGELALTKTELGVLRDIYVVRKYGNLPSDAYLVCKRARLGNIEVTAQRDIRANEDRNIVTCVGKFIISGRQASKIW